MISDTTIHADPTPAPKAPESAAARPAVLRELLFRDAESAAQWVTTLAVNDVDSACDDVLAQLRALAGADLRPRERARIAEVLREQVLMLHIELARRYAGRPQPARCHSAGAIKAANTTNKPSTGTAMLATRAKAG